MTCRTSLTPEKIRSVHGIRTACRVGTALIMTFGFLVSSPVVAQALDGNAVQALALQGTWAAEKDWGYWTWNADDTVCVRVLEPNGDCSDTGTWAINGEALCYELTWFGESYDVRENCVTVHPLEDGRYDARYHGGALESTFFIFKVIN